MNTRVGAIPKLSANPCLLMLYKIHLKYYS